MTVRRGVVLIEVLCAVAIVATVAVGALSILLQSGTSYSRASELHQQTVLASHLLSRAVAEQAVTADPDLLRPEANGLVLERIPRGDVTRLRVLRTRDGTLLLETYVMTSVTGEDR